MNAKESMEAMVDAYLLPTIGLKYFFVISLLYLLMYAFEVVEIVSRSGNRVCWNLIGRSLISDTKSCSSSPSSSSQLGFCCVVCFCVLGGGFVFCEVGLVVLLFLSELEIGLILMMLSGSEENFVLVLVEFFDELGLDIDFDVVEFSFLMSSDFLERESSVAVLVEFVVVLRGLVWFFVVMDKLGLMSLVLLLLDEEEKVAGLVVVAAVVVLGFLFGLFCFFSCSSSKSVNIDLLLPPRIWFLL
ncbi:hypothetical protein LWI28_023906 [Acer negundo]|uniref:Transmembrane protein n=1 Tax=Acer negundo TaxID=4023 RepID=A0AAD5IK86_ACENE|nr:hypothetical protein LWI28_023906 [Acer negundo]